MAAATMKASKSSRGNKKSGHLNSIHSFQSLSITPTPRPPPLPAPTLSAPSFPATPLPALSPLAPQDIGIHSVVMNPIFRPDPFGVQAVVPTGGAARELVRKAPWHHKVKNYIRSEVSDLKDRTIHAFSAPHRRMEELRANAAHHEEPGESDEDIGTRKARAVSRNWKRTDLMACYICLVIPASYFSFGSTNSVLIINEALHDFAMRGEVRFYQYELALSMLDVSKIIGIIIFAKLTNTQSRPLALLVASLVACGGMGLAAFAVTWESFSAGTALFHLGRSGILLVSQVIVADTSDLSWRGIYLWGLEMSSILWVWSAPTVAKYIVGKVEWNVPIWIFFSFSIPVMIPPIVTTYIFYRRAKHGGFFPASNHVYNHIWWSPKGLWRRLSLLSCELDLLGMFLWSLGMGPLATTLSMSEKMQIGIGMRVVALVIAGCSFIMLLALWELWLNKGLKTTHKARRQARRAPRVTWGALPGERVMMMGPAAPVGYNSISMEQAAAELSVQFTSFMIFQSTDVYEIQTFQIFMSQAITGFGAGIVWTSLLVGVQASCKTHSDVGMSIALLTTSNALGELAAGAVKRSMQAYMMNVLPPETSPEYFLRALGGHWSVMLMVAIIAAALALVTTGVGLTGYNLDNVKQHVSGVVFGRDDADRHNLLDEHASSQTLSPFVSTPELQDSPLNAPTSSPSTTHLDGVRTTENYNAILLQNRARFRGISPPPRPRSFSEEEEESLPKTEKSMDKQERENTEWETAPSESAKAIFRPISDSCTALSPPSQIPESYGCVFTMDSDLEPTSQATTSKEVESSKKLGIDPSPPQQANTVECRGPAKMKTLISKARASNVSEVAESSSSCNTQFSFKKRPIVSVPFGQKGHLSPENNIGLSNITSLRNTIIQGKSAESEAQDKPTRSNSTSTSNKESSESSSAFEESIVVNGSFDAQTPIDWDILDGISANGSVRTPESNSLPEFGDSGSGQASPYSHAVLGLSSDGEQEILQRWQSWVEDGDISDVPSEAREASDEEPSLPSGQGHHGVSQITSEVNALTVKNSYSPEQYLSTIEELSSKAPSTTNSVDMSFIGGAGSQFQARPPLVIGVLSPYHSQPHGRAEGDMAGAGQSAAAGSGPNGKRNKNKKRGMGKKEGVANSD
ncbi:uncharacterized protein LAJ45_09487 [Morchella importuna]|uniref:uncharacterized protein n=1 Tax=Morchella importuna TaxID=1174673 RepID=UPI001E8E7204|nr:uncharacterized protein LAJ45_09487 [Morchella importuna]KAH8146541.1 hypothetical protein LAJ45_09487 [Morchella importuna]